VQDLHLMTASGKYILEVRGKTAERKIDQSTLSPPLGIFPSTRHCSTGIRR